MRCDECLPLMEEYLDRELDADGEREMSLHLETCELCSNALQELTVEHNVYAAYKPELEVSSELWNGVQARIAKPSFAASAAELWRRPNSIFRPTVSAWAAALMVLVAVGLTIVAMKYTGPWSEDTRIASKGVIPRKDTPSPEQPNAPVKVYDDPGKSDRASLKLKGTNKGKLGAALRSTKLSANRPEILTRTKTPDRLVREAEQKYLAAIAMLSRNVERRRNRLDSETLARFQQTLNSIDRTIAATRQAVRRYPSDPVAVQYMLTAYSKKVDVLREMADY